jgi:hypothetical protein
MLGNYRVAPRLVASRGVLNTTGSVGCDIGTNIGTLQVFSRGKMFATLYCGGAQLGVRPEEIDFETLTCLTPPPPPPDRRSAFGNATMCVSVWTDFLLIRYLMEGRKEFGQVERFMWTATPKKTVKAASLVRHAHRRRSKHLLCVGGGASVRMSGSLPASFSVMAQFIGSWLTDGGEFSLTRGPTALSAQEDSGTHFC